MEFELLGYKTVYEIKITWYILLSETYFWQRILGPAPLAAGSSLAEDLVLCQWEANRALWIWIIIQGIKRACTG